MGEVPHQPHEEGAKSDLAAPYYLQKSECAYLVMDGKNAPEGFTSPGELYFCRPLNFKGNVPQNEEDAKQQLEDVSSVLRIVFQDEYPSEFDKYFHKLLMTAQATFDPVGFRPQPLNDLARFKGEIAQQTGRKIKSKYIDNLLKSTVLACIAIMVAAALISAAGWALHRYGVIVPSDPSKSNGNPNSQRGGLEIPSFVRWEGGYTVGHMGILLASSMWGLFLAAVLRNYEVSFEKLKIPDNELILSPKLRIIVFGILIFTIAVILNQRFVVVSIGDIFSSAEITKSTSTALLIGVFLGFSERALPTELESWAAGFLGKIQNARNTTVNGQ